LLNQKNTNDAYSLSERTIRRRLWEGNEIGGNLFHYTYPKIPRTDMIMEVLEVEVVPRQA
ncbi:MAG TPA: hypothetical protein VK125_07305, partial [Bacillota bacterium]|nr:hypothetical protein [Bacillota bacterium]